MNKETIKQFCDWYQTDLILARVQMPVILEAFAYFSLSKENELKELLDKYQIDLKGVK